jgi:hypothetical protein
LINKGPSGDSREGERSMIEHTTSFDGDLQMFRDAPRVANLPHLRFHRWLIEQGRSEHPPAGPPAGELAEAVSVTSSPVETDALLPAPAR